MVNRSRYRNLLFNDFKVVKKIQTNQESYHVKIKRMKTAKSRLDESEIRIQLSVEADHFIKISY